MEDLPPTKDAKASVRGLFRRLGDRVNAPYTLRTDLDIKSIKRHQTEWRRSIRELWESARPGEIEGDCFPWPELVVDKNRCIACGICMQMCPSGAIRHMLRGEMFSYRFTPGVCIDCGLCGAACRQHAITQSHAPTPTPFAEVACYTQSATTCIRCGGPALESSRVGEYCRNCALELGMTGGDGTKL